MDGREKRQSGPGPDNQIHPRDHLAMKIVIGIRGEASSTVYRAALSTDFDCCFGFLLGTREPLESPSVEFSLISAIPTTRDRLWAGPELLYSQFPASQRVAAHTGTTVIGLLAAWDTSPGERRNQLLGLWIDTAKEMQLPFVIHFPTTAHEHLLAKRCFFAPCFPHDALAYRNTRGRLSDDPRHNPRRVRALWRASLHPADET